MPELKNPELKDAALNFQIKVLGRTLEHLGVQMYKRRDVALAELVANSWDAGSQNVFIAIPPQDRYDKASSKIVVTDDGMGMTAGQVETDYLVVGRNRRRAGGLRPHDRAVMGRKGIGKLAGFGVASKMTVITWQDNEAVRFTLDVNELTREDGVTADVPIRGFREVPPVEVSSHSGTRIVLENLKHDTPLDLTMLSEALGRRFSRSVRGLMNIYINEAQVTEPSLPLELRVPGEEGLDTAELSDGSTVKYYYGFAKEPIKSPQMRGFTIHVNGKTAQAPPFFFMVEGTASGQHGTRYMTGAIEADYLDQGTDNESDKISTDRQEIDWEDQSLQPLKEWGDALTRKALREWANRRGEVAVEQVHEDNVLTARIERLEPTTKAQVWKFVKMIGQAETAPERALPLADALVRAYEYRNFHDVISQIEQVGDDPEQLYRLLSYLTEWKVLESRAILEIIKGRLDVVEKFHNMIVNDAPETPNRNAGADNMHDLIAWYPWLINPDWQVLSEEKGVTTQLREWNVADVPGSDDRTRFDFLALTGEQQLVIIEIKRSGRAVEFDELQRLIKYKERLSKGRANIFMMMICGGTVDISASERDNWRNRPDGDIVTWSEIYAKTHRYYSHYKAVLEGSTDHTDFAKKAAEIAQTRHVLLTGGTYRGAEARAGGLGSQDVDHQPS